MAALATAGSAAAHGVSTPRDHAREDSVVESRATQARLNRHTKKVSAAESRAANVAGTPDEVGQWGPVVDWPVVAVVAALLPNGKVLAYDSVGDHGTETYPDQTFSRATVWDPTTGSQTDVRVTTGFNIFCSGLAHLIDGSLFIAGGNKDQALNGIVQTHLFDPATNTWSLGPNMDEGRWYPSVTPLSNGEMLITSGGPDIPEVRQTGGSLRSLDSASLNLPLYPWIDVAPDGRTFVSGPDPIMRSLDTTGAGSWTTFGQRDDISRTYGSHAFYDIGKILVAGGGDSVADARVIDVNGLTPQVSATSPMAYGRRQLNLAVLADGTVLATGGNSSGAALVDMNAGVYPAELWNPATGNWKTLASMSVTRQYHSTALLLPDGRVLSAGGGVCSTCDQVGYLAKNAEVFSPPYLFKNDGSGQLAPRPTIALAPSSARYGSRIPIVTPDSASIRKVALVRLGAVTHSVNMEQRYVPLSFTAGHNSLTATIPANVDVAPPGFYMLFIIDGAGVPSVAKMVQLDATAAPPPPAAPTISATVPDSPANDNDPEVTGSAEAGSIVSIYGDPSCTGPVLGGGSAADFNGSTGIAAALPGDQTTDLTATATDSAGNTSGCSSPFAYTEDSTPPATHITGGPKGTTTKHEVKFVFSSTERHSGFECKLKRTRFAPCSSPVKKRVGLGKHRFKVKAIDPSGNTDASPAKRKFEVIRKRSGSGGPLRLPR